MTELDDAEALELLESIGACASPVSPPIVAVELVSR